MVDWPIVKGSQRYKSTTIDPTRSTIRINIKLEDQTNTLFLKTCREVGRMLNLAESIYQTPIIIWQYLQIAVANAEIKTKLLQSAIRNRTAHGVDAERLNRKQQTQRTIRDELELEIGTVSQNRWT